MKTLQHPNYLAGLREYLDALRAIGEVVDAEREVDWNLEIGAIIRRYETGAPAPLFKRIKGIEPGFRVLGAPAGSSLGPQFRFQHTATLSFSAAPN
jgi:4-hydroxy-3-polyprenylbenzoate decarboxylase